MLTESAHALFFLLAFAGMGAAFHWIYRQSRAWGVVVAAGAILRLASGLALAAISYYQWPLLQSLQAGDGFWAVAPDARVYFELASEAARRPSLSVPAGSPSPIYVLALGTWFRAAGATLASAVVFNLSCYVVAAAAIVWLLNASERRLGTLVLACVSFSPALLLTSTQVLKDAFFTLLIVLGCVGALVIIGCSRHSLTQHRARLAAGTAMALVAVAAMGGVRAYYAVFVWVAVASGLFVALWMTAKGRRASFAAFAAVMLVLLWCAFAVGADAYYAYYRQLIARTTGVNLSLPAVLGQGSEPVVAGSPDIGELGATLNTVRVGFIGSGGGTNLRTRAAFTFTGQGIRQVAVDLSVGLAATFVPISILRMTSLVEFDGGRGLLAITDLDTIFLGMTLVAMCVMIRQTRNAAQNLASVVFIVVLAAISALVIAYVVTNFGTLFRLRLMVSTPAWLAPLALMITAPVRRL